MQCHSKGVAGHTNAGTEHSVRSLLVQLIGGCGLGFPGGKWGTLGFIFGRFVGRWESQLGPNISIYWQGEEGICTVFRSLKVLMYSQLLQNTAKC